MRQDIGKALLAGTAAGAMMLAASPADAQDVLTRGDIAAMREQQRRIGQIEAYLNDYETARLRGACDELRAIGAGIAQRIGAFHTGVAEAPPVTVRELERRLEEARRRPCPPPGVTPESPPSLRTGQQPEPPEPPSGSTLRAELRSAGEACDVERWENARTRLLAHLDELIAYELDEARSDQLIRERDEVRRMNPPRCDNEEDILDEIGETGQVTSATASRDTTSQRAPQCGKSYSILVEEGTALVGDIRGYVTSRAPAGPGRERIIVSAGPGSTEYLDYLVNDERGGENILGIEEIPCPGREPEPVLRFGVDGGYRQYFIPRVGTGFSGQQQENPAAESDNKVGMTEFGGFIELPSGLRFGLSYGEGDASSSFDFPITNQSQFGAIFTAQGPGGGSGVQLQTFGMQVNTETEVQSFSADVAYDFLHGWIPRRGAARWAPFRVFGYGGFDRDKRDHRATLTSERTFFGSRFFVEQERVQQIDENRFGVGIGGRVDIPFSPRVEFPYTPRFNVRATATAGLFHYEAQLLSDENFRSNVVSSQDRDFTIRTRDSASGIGFRGSLDAAFEYRVAPKVSLFVGGGAAYLSNVGAIANPTSAEQLSQGQTAELRTDNAWAWRARAGIIIRPRFTSDSPWW